MNRIHARAACFLFPLGGATVPREKKAPTVPFPGEKASGEPAEPVTGTTGWTERGVIPTASANAFSAVLFFNLAEAVVICRFGHVSFAEPAPGQTNQKNDEYPTRRMS